VRKRFFFAFFGLTVLLLFLGGSTPVQAVTIREGESEGIDTTPVSVFSRPSSTEIAGVAEPQVFSSLAEGNQTSPEAPLAAADIPCSKYGYKIVKDRTANLPAEIYQVDPDNPTALSVFTTAQIRTSAFAYSVLYKRFYATSLGGDGLTKGHLYKIDGNGNVSEVSVTDSNGNDVTLGKNAMDISPDGYIYISYFSSGLNFDHVDKLQFIMRIALKKLENYL